MRGIEFVIVFIYYLPAGFFSLFLRTFTREGYFAAAINSSYRILVSKRLKTLITFSLLFVFRIQKKSFLPPKIV